MDKPPQLKSDIEKSDIELKVSDAEASSTDNSASSAEESAMPGFGQNETASPNVDANAKILQTANDRVMAQSERRAKEQEFLQEYKSKQLRPRFKFVAFAALVFAVYLSGVNFIFNNNEKAASALKKFQIAPLFASMGERDIAHYTMTEFSDASTKDTPGLIEQRTKILANSISEMEKNGKPAIFTRLGTEQMLMKYGDRDTGLKFGDPLISKYPDLLSNYFWRAKTDLERMDYSNSVLEYKEAAAKLRNLPPGENQDWQEQLSKAVWASIYSGQSGEAEKFLALYQKNGGNTYEFQGLQSKILLSSCADIAAPILKTTPFWNEKLAKEYENRLSKAVSSASEMNYSDVKFDTIPDVFRWELTDQAALLSTDNKRTTDYIDYHYGSESYWATTLRAKAALNRNSPQEALAINANEPQSKYRRYRREQEFIEASALQKLGRSKEAIRIVDSYLKLKPYDTDNDDDDESENRLQTLSNHYNRLLLLVKANALCDLGQYKRALKLSNSMLAQNPHLIEPRLINIRSYEGLKDTKAAATESEKITSELAAWMNSSQSNTRPEARLEAKTHD